MVASQSHYRFSAEEYQRLGEALILDPARRVELIDGEIIEMSPIGPIHVWSVTLLSDHISGKTRSYGFLTVQNPIRLGPYDEPQPDLALIRRNATPGVPFTAADVLFVIEVADSSRAYDRETKLRRYAAAGIPEAWLADLNGKLLERHSEPRDGLYRQIVVGRSGDTLDSTVVPELAIPVSLALGQPV